MRNLIDVETTVDYIFKRQNSDGGYTFSRGTESSAQDTFYAINVLNMLDVKPKNVKKTVAFLLVFSIAMEALTRLKLHIMLLNL